MSKLSIFMYERQQVRSVGTVNKPDWIAVNFIISFKNQTNLKQVFNQRTQILRVCQSNDLNLVIFRYFSLLARKDKP